MWAVVSQGLAPPAGQEWGGRGERLGRPLVLCECPVGLRVRLDGCGVGEQNEMSDSFRACDMWVGGFWEAQGGGVALLLPFNYSLPWSRQSKAR